MARSESITAGQILEHAFELTRQEGISALTARKVAAHAGCSTQPVFKAYKNMDELWEAVYEKAAEFFRDYYSLYPRTGKAPFSNLGMAYISFAAKEKQLFRMLFIREGSSTETPKYSMYELLNGPDGNVVYEVNLAGSMGCQDPSGLFMKMWMLIHGAACMALTGDYDLSEEETLVFLEKTCKTFLKEEEEYRNGQAGGHHIQNQGKI